MNHVCEHGMDLEYRCHECEYEYSISLPTTELKTTEKVNFRLFQMPCCGHLLCWVNPRFPNYCPECGKRVYPEIKNPEHTKVHQEQALLKW